MIRAVSRVNGEICQINAFLARIYLPEHISLVTIAPAFLFFVNAKE
ncbi:hypothetical protein D781_1789 [Serratia sp. FGI94]|nr:hypothetical protein D781_1789 [Serratia sp. FGI94]